MARSLLFVALLLLGGCVTEDEPIPRILPGDPICGDVTRMELGLEGDACRAEGRDCSWETACVDGVCGSCSLNSDCRNTQVCLPDSSCGACSSESPCSDGSDCVRGVCLADVRSIDLQVSTAIREELLNGSRSSREFHDCTLSVDGVQYADPCEVRLFGESTRIYPKRSFRIQFAEDVEHPGYARKISLRSEYADPSMMRTHLSYETFSRLTSVPTPDSRYAWLTINGAPHGLMLDVERIGGRFLEQRGRDREAVMYEAEHPPPPGGLMPLPSNDDYRELDGTEMYTTKVGDDFGPLIQLIEGVLAADLAASPSAEETVLDSSRDAIDVDGHLRYLAVMAILQGRDHVETNYHFSPQPGPDGRVLWEFYPWDLDTTLGCVRDSAAQSNLCQGITSDVWPWGGVGPDDEPFGWPHVIWMNGLIHLTLNESSCQQGYQAQVCDWLDSDWWTTGFENHARALGEHLGPWVAQDTQDRNDSPGDFSDAVSDLLTFPALRAAHLRAEMGCD